MLRIQKKLYILLYENRKYQSKMCTNSLYHVTKNLQYKKTYENDQITQITWNTEVRVLGR